MKTEINQVEQIITSFENKSAEFDQISKDIIDELRRAFNAHISGDRDAACDHMYCALALYKSAPHTRKLMKEIKEGKQ